MNCFDYLFIYLFIFLITWKINYIRKKKSLASLGDNPPVFCLQFDD